MCVSFNCGLCYIDNVYSSYNHDCFVTFLIDTIVDAKPGTAENVWTTNISRLTRDSSVPPSVRKRTMIVK
ncbi:hypothetical protein RclHR1_00520030 [Rhizophagus clarus]|uniref:Uncharacterized protein n=1 Tax=Rhizophagus clarus TaxID=94130 RepID=A0A2Z6RKY5_9GLOM|nr:hypothetical protein RclHR1_00520030 [Rhizophagus clarus]